MREEAKWTPVEVFQVEGREPAKALRQNLSGAFQSQQRGRSGCRRNEGLVGARAGRLVGHCEDLDPEGRAGPPKVSAQRTDPHAH